MSGSYFRGEPAVGFLLRLKYIMKKADCKGHQNRKEHYARFKMMFYGIGFFIFKDSFCFPAALPKESTVL